MAYSIPHSRSLNIGFVVRRVVVVPGMDAPRSALFWRVGMVVVVIVDGVGPLDDVYTLLMSGSGGGGSGGRALGS